jgi:hypothetical protein
VKKAIIVVAHALLVIIWHILATGKPYDELGEDYFTRRANPPNAKRAASSKNSKLSAAQSPWKRPPDPSRQRQPTHKPRRLLPPARLGTIHVSGSR